MNLEVLVSTCNGFKFDVNYDNVHFEGKHDDKVEMESFEKWKDNYKEKFATLYNKHIDNNKLKLRDDENCSCRFTIYVHKIRSGFVTGTHHGSTAVPARVDLVIKFSNEGSNFLTLSADEIKGVRAMTADGAYQRILESFGKAGKMLAHYINKKD